MNNNVFHSKRSNRLSSNHVEGASILGLELDHSSGSLILSLASNSKV